MWVLTLDTPVIPLQALAVPTGALSVKRAKHGGSIASGASTAAYANGAIRLTVSSNDTDTLGSLSFEIVDTLAVVVGVHHMNVVNALDLALDPIAVRAAVGLEDADLDTQLAAGVGIDGAGVRTAIGLASANLDTQLSRLRV